MGPRAREAGKTGTTWFRLVISRLQQIAGQSNAAENICERGVWLGTTLVTPLARIAARTIPGQPSKLGLDDEIFKGPTSHENCDKCFDGKQSRAKYQSEGQLECNIGGADAFAPRYTSDHPLNHSYNR